jgi:hypothetical protein
MRDLIGAKGKPERWLLHTLLQDGWDAADVAATLRELGVVRERPFGKPFDYLRLPDERPERRQPAAFRFRGPNRGGNLRPGRQAPSPPPKLGGRKI